MTLIVLRHELLFSYYFTPILRPACYWSIQTSDIPEAVGGPVNGSIKLNYYVGICVYGCISAKYERILKIQSSTGS